MARRLFNGRAFSENGWPYVDQGSCKWFQIAQGVTIQIQEGAPYACLGAFARDYHAYVEPIYDPDCACWTEGNSVATSNHPGGTAMDLRWQSHPFQKRGTFTAAQIRTIQELLDFYEGTVFWAGVDWKEGGWGSPIDEMHWQVGYRTFDQAANAVAPWVNDFIARKIRADGFSTFRRGNAAQPDDPALILSRATGLDLNRATEILPAVRDGLLQSDCTTPLRIAHWIAQVGHESVSFKYTEEIAKNGRYAPYIGRTWIQITWDYNYRAFSEWCFARGLVPTADYFVSKYQELADIKWAGIGAAWYWTVQRPMNSLVDAGDSATWKAGSVTYRGFDAVTAAINGGLNGNDDRRVRYNRAIAVGDALTNILNGDDELADPAIVKKINEIHAALFNKVPSQSLYATPGEGARWQLHELIKNMDGTKWDERVESLATTGVPWAIEAVALVAGGKGNVRDAWVVNNALRILAEIEATHPEYLQNVLSQKGVA